MRLRLPGRCTSQRGPCRAFRSRTWRSPAPWDGSSSTFAPVTVTADVARSCCVRQRQRYPPTTRHPAKDTPGTPSVASAEPTEGRDGEPAPCDGMSTKASLTRTANVGPASPVDRREDGPHAAACRPGVVAALARVSPPRWPFRSHRRLRPCRPGPRRRRRRVVDGAANVLAGVRAHGGEVADGGVIGLEVAVTTLPSPFISEGPRPGRPRVVSDPVEARHRRRRCRLPGRQRNLRPSTSG